MDQVSLTSFVFKGRNNMHQPIQDGLEDFLAGQADRESRIKGLAAGADDFLTKPVDGQELLARVGSLARLKRYTDDLDSAASIIMALGVMIEARAGYTEGHCHRVANHATALGRRVGLSVAAGREAHRDRSHHFCDRGGRRRQILTT